MLAIRNTHILQPSTFIHTSWCISLTCLGFALELLFLSIKKKELKKETHKILEVDCSLVINPPRKSLSGDKSGCQMAYIQNLEKSYFGALLTPKVSGSHTFLSSFPLMGTRGRHSNTAIPDRKI